MQLFLIIATVLSTIIYFAHGQDPSAGSCGPTSIPNVPGCWGTPGCAYVIASDLGPGAACPYDYCDCGGINVPLLPTTILGTPTIGCGSYTVQPSANNCPTTPAVIPTNPAGSPVLNSVYTNGSTSSSISPPPPLPTGGTVVSGVVGTQVITETYVPTEYTQLAGVTATITTTILDFQGSTITVVVGPSGEGWAPFNEPSGAANIPVPSILPSVSSQPPASNTEADSSAPFSSVSGETVVTGTVGSQKVVETFVPVIVSELASLASTITTTTLNAQQISETIVIGPGGVRWTPLNQEPSGVTELPPPTILPINPNAPSIIPPSNIPPITTNAASLTLPASTPISSTGVAAAPQSSATDAFAIASQSETVLQINGITLPYSKATFSNLATITAPTTVTTPVVETNKDGSTFTISAAIIVVGPGGVWWNGGTGGFGIQGPSCIWPFCPPGGGGDTGGGGSGSSPNDPNTPGSNEEPSDPNDDNNSASQSSEPSSTSSCGASSVVSDCSVICSTATSATTQTCSTSCYSTVTGCSATGTTITSTASATATGQPCSPSCSTCNEAPIKLKMPRRGLSKRTIDTSGNNLSKRVLKTPADYGGNTMQFLLSEYAFAEWLNIHGSTDNSRSTAIGRSLNNQRYDAAVHGLYGCTSVVVVSQQAVWLSHFWEIPSFRATAANWGQPATAEDTANFQQDVINALQNGDGTADMPGLTQFTGAGGQFNSAQRPVWAIITPRANSGVAGEYRYDPEVTQIQGVLRNLFPNAPPVVVDYVPRSDQNSQSNTASGKILFQYDPFQALLTDPNNPCEVYQQAMFRLWVEDRPNYVWQKYWAAEANQLITNFAAHQNKHKRDNPSCQIPSSLPEAATELSGPDMVFSQAPDPDTTSWITLDGAAQTTAESASPTSTASGSTGSINSSTPPTTPAPTATPQCMADGAPWMSPTSFCDCGASATYPTLSPISGATTANCAYATLPASTIQPISTASAPTNIPGEGGVPGCNLELAADQGLPSGSSNFCNCGGITASVLVTTVSGTASSNCDYPTVPPGGFNPVPSTSAPAPSPTPPPAPYATGRCNVHVWEGIGQEIGQKDVYIEVNITDAAGSPIGSAHNGLGWGQTFDVDSALANVLEVTPHGNFASNKNKRRDFTDSVASPPPSRLVKRIGGPPPPRLVQEKGRVAFALGAQSWDSTAEQCSTGKYDNGDANNFFGSIVFGDEFIPNRQMDCKFDC